MSTIIPAVMTRMPDHSLVPSRVRNTRDATSRVSGTSSVMTGSIADS